MASRYRWRQRLLGSLQGQLQLATYLVVFLGFTGASSVGLLIGQRNLLANDRQLARQSIDLCDKAIRGLQDDPAQLEQELLFHSNANTSLWIEDNSGMLLRPRIHRSLSDAAIQTAMATNPGREPGLQRTIDIGNANSLWSPTHPHLTGGKSSPPTHAAAYLTSPVHVKQAKPENQVSEISDVCPTIQSAPHLCQ